MNASRASRRSRWGWRGCLVAQLLASLCLPLAPAVLADNAPVSAADQAAQYRAEVPKTIVELQQFRRSDTIAAEGAGNRHGTATLIDLNPDINAWFLLTLDWGDAGGRASYHLENPDPRDQRLSLAESQPHGILISTDSGNLACDLWSGDPTPLKQARNSIAALRTPLSGSSLPAKPGCGAPDRPRAGDRFSPRPCLERGGHRRLRARHLLPRRLYRESGSRRVARACPRASRRPGAGIAQRRLRRSRRDARGSRHCGRRIRLRPAGTRSLVSGQRIAGYLPERHSAGSHRQGDPGQLSEQGEFIWMPSKHPRSTISSPSISARSISASSSAPITRGSTGRPAHRMPFATTGCLAPMASARPRR